MSKGIVNVRVELPVSPTRGDSPRREPKANRRVFSFDLCQKDIQCGDFSFSQFWMHLHGLHGDRGRSSANHRAILDAYWAICRFEGTDIEDGVRSSYVLAELLPRTRSNASRRVFKDATLRRNGGRKLKRDVIVDELNKLLAHSARDPIDPLAFQRQTGEILGPHEYPPEVYAQYLVMHDELLSGPYKAMDRGLAVVLEDVEKTWGRLTRQIGRRAGNPVKKQVLDIFSYEARAAFRSCYSTVWTYLLPQLQLRFNLSREAVLFHHLWHLDLRAKAKETPDADFHLFHGSVFALHPACGNFVATQAGTALMAGLLSEKKVLAQSKRLLENPSAEHELTEKMLKFLWRQKSFCGFLQGILLSIYDYDGRHDLGRDRRTK